MKNITLGEYELITDESDGEEIVVRHASTGEEVIFDQGGVRTSKVGIQAAVGTNQEVPDNTETVLEIDDVAPPFFDDFGELDADNNKIVIAQDGVYEVSVHVLVLDAKANSQVTIKIKENGTTRDEADDTVNTGDNISVETSLYLKLEAGDEIQVTVQHTAGQTETFQADNCFVSVIRQ